MPTTAKKTTNKKKSTGNKSKSGSGTSGTKSGSSKSVQALKRSGKAPVNYHTGSYKAPKTIYTTDVIVEEHEFAQNKDNGAGADLSETQKTDKDGFMEAPEGEIPFD